MKPKVVKKAQRAVHPISNAKYGVERSVATSIRSGYKPKAKLDTCSKRLVSNPYLIGRVG
jgi:hypothetical protein